MMSLTTPNAVDVLAGSRRRREFDRRASELRRRAATLLGSWPADAGGRADEMLALVSSISDVLSTEAVESTLAGALGALAADLQELALDLYDHDATARSLRMAGFDAAVRRLHAETNSAHLVQTACDEVRVGCGMARVLMSRVESGHCRPLHTNTAARGEPWFASWADGTIDLDALALAHVVAERRPDVIDTARTDNHEMIRLSRSTSYVVAPIRPAGDVVGLFHADHGSDGPRCDETDRDLLRVYTEVFSHAFERASLLARLELQHQHLRNTIALANLELSATRALWADDVEQTTIDLSELTAREHDVLRLLSSGLANQPIATQLGITTRTVKAHVSQILGKLDARNRSELIARLHRHS
jgi:DNA-binding CsgD family transcriptional regulator